MTTETKSSIFEPDILKDGRLLLTENNKSHFGPDNCLVYSRRKDKGLFAVLALTTHGKTLMNGHMRVTYGAKDDMSKDAFWDYKARFCCVTEDGLNDFRDGGFVLLWEPWRVFRIRIGENLDE